MNKTRVLIVDDHPLFRFGIKSLLNMNNDIEVVAEADGERELFRLIRTYSPDIILMDFFLSEFDGAQLTAKVKAVFPKMHVLGISSSTEQFNINKMIKAGIGGFVSKETSPGELVKAINALMRGQQYFYGPITSLVMSKDKKSSRKGELKEITERELEILQYVANEYTNKEIAAELFISPRTVETHKRNIMQKLKVKNSAGLVRYYYEAIKQVS